MSRSHSVHDSSSFPSPGTRSYRFNFSRRKQRRRRRWRSCGATDCARCSKRSCRALSFCAKRKPPGVSPEILLPYQILRFHRESLLVYMARRRQAFFGEAVRGAPACCLRGTKAAQWLRVATGTRNQPRGHTSCRDLRDRQCGSRHPPRTSP